jgi:hypothetical protein
LKKDRLFFLYSPYLKTRSIAILLLSRAPAAPAHRLVAYEKMGDNDNQSGERRRRESRAGGSGYCTAFASIENQSSINNLLKREWLYICTTNNVQLQ